MSAPFLRRGDKIHLAVPYGDGRPGLTVPDAQEQARQMAETLSRNYAEMGVTVVFWNGSNALTQPVVVAVFREEA